MKVTRNNLFLLATLVISFVVYIGSLNAPFYLDDEITILRNPAIDDFFSFLTGGHWQKLNYRSTSFLSFSLIKSFAGENPFWFRLTTLILHLLNGFLFYTLLQKISNNKVGEIGLFFALIVFLVHPIQVQPLVYITQQMAVLATTFYLLIFHTYHWLRHQQKIWVIIGGGAFLLILFVLGFKSKQTVATAPLAFIAFEVLWYRDQKSKKWAGVLIFSLFIAVIAYSILGLRTFETTSITRLDYFLTEVKVLALYLKQVVWPFSFSLEHDPMIESFGNFSVSFFLSCLVHVGLMVLAVLSFKKFRFVTLGVALFYVFHLIESSVFPIRDPMFEHRMYLPMLALSMVFIEIGQWEQKRVGVGLLLTVLLGFSLQTINISSRWNNPEQIWKNAIATAPEKPRSYVNLGMHFLKRQKTDSASQYFEMALNINPNNVEALNNLGSVYVNQGNCEEAIHLLNKSIALNPKNKFALHNLAICWEKREAYHYALNMVNKALRLDPFFYEALFTKGVVLEGLGENDSAAVVYNQVAAIKPDYPYVYFNLGNALLKSGNNAPSIESYRTSIRYNYTSADLFGNLAIAFFYESKLDSALKYAQLAVQEAPERADLQRNLTFISSQ